MPESENGTISFEVESEGGSAEPGGAIASAPVMVKDSSADNPMYSGGKADASVSPNFKADEWGVSASDDVFEDETVAEGEEDEEVEKAVSEPAAVPLHCCRCTPCADARAVDISCGAGAMCRGPTCWP